MANLYVVGDSFVSIEDTQHIEHDWIKLLGKNLGVDRIINNGVIGSSQDFAWASLQNWEPYIQPEDYIVVVVTHPARYWFFQEEPSITKADHIEHFKGSLSQYRYNAAKLYVQYIQRPSLDAIHVENRIGWLAYTTLFRNWRTPIVINAMETEPLKFNYPNINFSKGTLTTVSFNEVKKGVSVEDYTSVIQRVDPRYNHLCLSNHSILANKVFDTLSNNIELDLTSGFVENILSIDKINDLEFQKQELCLDAVSRRATNVDIAKKEYSAWKFKSMFGC